MPTHHLQYRGYKIKIMRRDAGWHIEAIPRSPAEPYLQSVFFFLDRFASEEDAIRLIQKEIDRPPDLKTARCLRVDFLSQKHRIHEDERTAAVELPDVALTLQNEITACAAMGIHLPWQSLKSTPIPRRRMKPNKEAPARSGSGLLCSVRTGGTSVQGDFPICTYHNAAAFNRTIEARVWLTRRRSLGCPNTPQLIMA